MFPHYQVQEKGSKFDLVITFGAEEDKNCNIYLKHFRSLKKAKVEKVNFNTPADALILPAPSSFGIFSARSSVLGQIVRNLGAEFVTSVQDYIIRKYLGEQPVGTAFILKSPLSQYKFIVVVALFRVLTCRGDEMSWLDPGYVPMDFAYNALRGALLAILRHNASSKSNICSILCPDLFAIRREAPGGELLTDDDFELIVQQMVLAMEGIFSPIRNAKNWSEGILLQRQILDRDKKQGSKREDLLHMLNSGTLEPRGLYNSEELDLVIGWARSQDAKQRLLAAKVLAHCLHRTNTHFNVPKSEITNRITDKNSGCLSFLLELVAQREIVLHTEIPVEELHIGEVIGEGTAGSVYRGLWRDQRVAIKVFRNDVKLPEFIRELSLMSIVKHKNLVSCYGGVTRGGKMMIVQELMQANLGDVLATSEVPLSLGFCIQMAVEVANGVHYLHSHCNLIHRDLKTMNLLINTMEGPDIVVKVCDFGVSRVINKKKAMTGNIGTVSWIAPEVFQQRKYSEKADVYSFGIILWEFITRQVPFANLSSFGIPVAVIKGDRPLLPKDLPSAYKRLVRQCWSGQQKKRPSLNKVADALTKIYNNLPVKDKIQRNLDITPVLTRPKLNRQSTSTRLNWTRRLAREREATTLSQIILSSKGADQVITKSDSNYDNPELFSEIENDSYHEGIENATEIENENEEENYDENEFSNGEEEGDDGEMLPTQTFLPPTVTCVIPPKWSKPIADLELKVNRHFSQLKQDLDLGTIMVSQQRYLLFRGENFTADFLRTIRILFGLQDNKVECLEIAHNMLYDIGAEIGRADSITLFKKTLIADMVSRINSSFVNIAYTGMAYVNLMQDSELDDKQPNMCFIKTEFTKSFEAELWERRKGRGRVCVMSSGYISGWIENVIGSPFIYGEISCKKNREAECYLVGASPQRLEEKFPGIPYFLHSHFPSTHTWLERTLERCKSEGVSSPPMVSPQAVNFDPKRFTEPQNQVGEIEAKAAEQLDNFFIDPTLAEVELAEERCLLIQSNTLATGFYKLAQKLLPKSDKIDLFCAKFLYTLGKSIGISDSRWFLRIVDLNNNAIERANALPVNLAYLGWCDLQIISGLESAELLETREKFKITCVATSSFEADSWNKWNQTVGAPLPLGNCSCFLTTGYIAGWFEQSFGFPVTCIESTCRSSKSPECEFIVSQTQHTLHHVPENTYGTNSVKIHTYSTIPALFYGPPDLSENLTKPSGAEKAIGRIARSSNRSTRAKSIDLTPVRVDSTKKAKSRSPSPKRVSPPLPPISGTGGLYPRMKRRNSFDSPRYHGLEAKKTSQDPIESGPEISSKLKKKKSFAKMKSQKSDTSKRDHKRSPSDTTCTELIHPLSPVEDNTGEETDFPFAEKRRSLKFKKKPFVKKKDSPIKPRTSSNEKKLPLVSPLSDSRPSQPSSPTTVVSPSKRLALSNDKTPSLEDPTLSGGSTGVIFGEEPVPSNKGRKRSSRKRNSQVIDPGFIKPENSVNKV